MARTRIRVHTGKDGITRNLDAFDARAKAAIALVFQYWAAKASTEMRNGAPWTDRTGNARAGLQAKASTEGSNYTLHFIHTMPYGVWLEVRWSGRYAIVGPTMASTAPQLAKMVADALKGINS